MRGRIWVRGALRYARGGRIVVIILKKRCPQRLCYRALTTLSVVLGLPPDGQRSKLFVGAY